MTAGMPDYTGIVRPGYGHAMGRTLYTDVIADELTTLMTVTGKGMTYGGNVWLEFGSNQGNSEVYLLIDGSNIAWMSFERLKKYGITKSGAYPITINKFDSFRCIFSVGISYGITFERSIALAYNEKHSGDPRVHWSLIYTLVQ